MNATQLRDLGYGILRTLYRAGGSRGRNAEALHSLVRQEVECELGNVKDRLVYLKGFGLVREEKPDLLSPGLDPYWYITSEGMAYAEEKHLVS